MKIAAALGRDLTTEPCMAILPRPQWPASKNPFSRDAGNGKRGYVLMKISALAGTTTLATLLALSAAGAVPFDRSQTRNLTEDGQDLFFAFDFLAEPAGPATVTIAAAGTLFIPGIDLSGNPGFDGKYFEATVDGTSLGFYSCGGPSTVGATVIPGTAGFDDAFDCEFSLPLRLSRETTDEALFDGRTIIGVLFGPGVQAFDERDEVKVTLSYETAAPIPLPASLPLLGAGFGGLALLWRRRRS